MQDLYIPRNKYILPIDEIGNCSNCDTVLVSESSSVLLYGRSDIDEGEFMSNRAGSHFCPNCPTVIFEKETIEETLSFTLRAKKGFNYDVLGLVDLDRVPKSKSHLPFGDDNPIPLVPFLNGINVEPRQLPKQKPKPKPFGDKKVGRNEPCLCGSGKKYKKCCL